MNIFPKMNYRKILRDILLERRKAFGLATFSFQKMAEHCRIQKAYLSSVLSGNAHFNSDQTFLACQFLTLNPEECEYIDLLHNYERSIAPQRKKILLQKIVQIRHTRLRTEENIQVSKDAESFTPSQLNRYFLNPDVQLVHLFLTLPWYQKNHDQIAQTLHLTKSRFDVILTELHSLGIIGLEKKGIVVLKDQLHLAQDSEVFVSYRTNLRLKALQQLSESEDSEKYSFSALFSCDEATRLSIKARFLEFLNSIQADVTKCDPKDVYQMNFDLFSWMK